MKIILKADDLAGYPGKSGVIPKRWQRFVDIIEKYKIKASIGIIGNSLIFDDIKYFEWIKRYNDLGIIEFFNHGFLHRQFNFDGEVYQEFNTTLLEYQFELISYTNTLFKEKVGIDFVTFGAPYNAVDENTSIALEKAGIKVGFFLRDNFKGINLKNRLELEVPTHKVNLKALKESLVKKDYVVIQLHPNSWEDREFLEFEEAVEYLSENEFILPKDML